MKVKEKINLNMDGLIKHGPINIVVFGDSVTHGAFDFGEVDFENCYVRKLAKKLNQKSSYIPVNVINAGIGGLTAVRSISRLDGQVLAHNPDLVIVCFGLNDVNLELDVYIGALREIFKKIKEYGADVIFMTPNMLNTYVNDKVPKEYVEYGNTLAEYQNNGRMDGYMKSAVDLAKEMGVIVCDVYSEWKKLSKEQDTTLLLANGLNHPIKEMHDLFADMLFEIIFKD